MNCTCECDTYFNVKRDDGQYILSDFHFENLAITAKENGYTDGIVKNMQVKNVNIELTK